MTQKTPIKFVQGSETLIEGWAIPFGGPFRGKDLDGEDFGPDTDFALDLYPSGRPLLYHHGLDDAVKLVAQGRQTEHDVRDEGVWAQAQLDKSAKYHATVAKLIAAGKMYFSSGSVGHLVDTDDDGHIKRWPWVELSLTTTPANPWAGVHSVKMTELIEHTTAANLEVPTALIAAALKALDDTKDGLENEPFADQGQRVLADLSGFVERAQERHMARGKVGRVLSSANRTLLASYLEHIDALAAKGDEIRELLRISDPDSEKAATSVLAEFTALEARLQGVAI